MFESRMYGNVMRNSIVCSIGIEKLFESIVHETLSKHICTHDTYNNDYELNHYTMEQRNGEKEKKNHLSEYAPTGTNSSSKLLFSSWSKKESSKKKLFLCVLETKMELNWKIAVIWMKLSACHINVFFFFFSTLILNCFFLAPFLFGLRMGIDCA